jgi:hypothetical protein
MRPKVDPRTGIALGGRRPALPSHIVAEEPDKKEDIKLSNSDLQISEEDLEILPVAVTITKLLLDDRKDKDESDKTK